MNEGPLEIPEEEGSTLKPERAPSYEKALDALRSLRVAGIADPFDTENPMVQSGLDSVDEWEFLADLPMRGIESVEKATNTVKASMLFVDAGYAEPQFLRQALERLNDEYADILNQEGADEIREILSDAIEVLEQKLTQTNPKEKVANEIEGCIDEAKQKVKSGDPKEIIDAIRLLTSTLLHPSYKRYFSRSPEEREYIVQLRTIVQNIKVGGDPAQIDTL